MGKRVVLIYPIPEIGRDVPITMAKAKLFGFDLQGISVSYKAFLKRNSTVIKAFDELGQLPGLIRVRPSSVLCNTFIKDRCAAIIDNRPFYYDDSHLSNTGAALVVREIMKVLKE